MNVFMCMIASASAPAPTGKRKPRRKRRCCWSGGRWQGGRNMQNRR